MRMRGTQYTELTSFIRALPELRRLRESSEQRAKLLTMSERHRNQLKKELALLKSETLRLQDAITQLRRDLDRSERSRKRYQASSRKLSAENKALSLENARLATEPEKATLLRAVLFRPAENLSVATGETDTTLDPQLDDLGIIVRLTAAYIAAADEQLEHKDGKLAEIFNTYNQHIHHGLMEVNTALVADELRNPAASMVFAGLDSLNASLTQELTDPDTHKHYVTRCLDGLARFADALGIVRQFNPEAVALESLGADELLAAIETELKIPVTLPAPFPGEIGAKSSRGIISYHVPQALYQAWRIRELTRAKRSPRVLEIGGSIGRAAFYARQMGITDYTIVDLPIVGVSQGYFLTRALGDEAVLLNGESTSDAAHRIKILPPSRFLTGDSTYDLIVNSDSFTDLPDNQARAYMAQIENATELFLSINPEQNKHTVMDYVAECGSLASRVRAPYWMRQGYAEELFRFQR